MYRTIFIISVIVLVSFVVIHEIPVSFAQVIDYPDLGVRVETVADNLKVPWSIDWLSDDIMIITERGGTLYVLKSENDRFPILSLDVQGGEGGLLGVAVDPDFEVNSYIYIYYTYGDLFSLYNKVVRYQYDDSDDTIVLSNVHTVIDKIPGSSFHDGGRIQFGPDGMLYVATGDAGNPDLSQDVNSLAGKILRINSDGSIPDDNPWEDSPVYSMGHRNPQGMDWTSDGIMIITEHGPSGWVGTGHDEINVIKPGKNYGWPYVIGDKAVTDTDINVYQDPLFHTGYETWAPSGSEFYESNEIPEWHNKYFVASLRGQSLWMLDIVSNDTLSVKSSTALFSNEFGRLRDVQTGPDGYLYVLTSNQDGRGVPKLADDKIFRIVPLYDSVILDDMMATTNTKQQKLTTFSYDGNETASTGPLYASVRHPGYDVHDFSFNITQKSMAFEFALQSNTLVNESLSSDERLKKYEESMLQSNTLVNESLSLYIQKPLLSPPFEIIIYDDFGNLSYDNNVDVKYNQDNYIVVFDPRIESGRIMIIGTHVIPEYEYVMVIMFISTIILFSSVLLYRRFGFGLFYNVYVQHMK